MQGGAQVGIQALPELWADTTGLRHSCWTLVLPSGHSTLLHTHTHTVWELATTGALGVMTLSVVIIGKIKWRQSFVYTISDKTVKIQYSNGLVPLMYSASLSKVCVLCTCSPFRLYFLLTHPSHFILFYIILTILWSLWILRLTLVILNSQSKQSLVLVKSVCPGHPKGLI